MRFAHTNIVSTDWRVLADFYINTFNCKVVPPIRKQRGAWLDAGTGVSNASLEGVHLALPGHSENGPTLEIYQYREIADLGPATPNTRGFGHIAFEVDDVAMLLQVLIANGGKAVGRVTKRTIEGVGEITFVYARDPEGNLIELQSWQ